MSKNKENIAVIDENLILKKLIADYSGGAHKKLIDSVEKGTISKKEFLVKVSEHISDEYAIQDEQIIKKVAILFFQYMFGYFRITPLIEDPEITDIHCLSWDNVRIKKLGQRCGTNVKFASESEFEGFINKIAIRNGVTITNLNAIQRFSDNESNERFILRFTVATGLVTASNTPVLVIRKTAKDFMEMEDLVEAGMMSQKVADVLVKRYNAGSMLICGGNSSGKTTLLNALSEKIPDDKSVMVCQQVDEISTKNHPDTFFMHEVPPVGESKICYDLKEISIQGLTMDVDYFIIGEIKGAEALYFLNAAYTGQKCSGTIHAYEATKALKKLTDYAMYESKYRREQLLDMMTCIDTVVFMKDFKVQQVVSVERYNPEIEDIEYKTIYQRKAANS